MTDFRALCLELLKALTTTNPSAFGKFAALEDRARAALAEPQPAADGEVIELLAEMRRICFDVAPCDSDVITRAADLLERWGNYPATGKSGLQVQPIPVSERLPEAGDCDAEGRCWWWYAPVPEQTYGYWLHEDNATERALDEWPTHWLPFNALPLPKEVE